jgi:hydroxymethylpyrimidine pyrophosphatase-like HAD family hydrolase
MIPEGAIRLGKKSSCPRKEEAMRTIYVTDLDGTLLNTESRINPESLSIINELVEQGMLFTYATARSLESASVVTEGLRLTMPVIVYNGAFIMRPRTQEPSLTGDNLFSGGPSFPENNSFPGEISLLRQNLFPGEILYSQFFTREEAGFIRENLEKAGISPLVYSFIRERESVSWNTARENEGIKHYLSNRRWDRRLRPLESAEGLYDGNIFYYTCIGEKEELMPLYEVFSRDRRLRCTIQQELYRPEYWCEVMPGKATKAQAIRTLKDMYSCDRVVSFGDAINDIPMFELSDECYAVENAVPELKRAATGIVGSNVGDGVAKWLRENVK